MQGVLSNENLNLKPVFSQLTQDQIYVSAPYSILASF